MNAMNHDDYDLDAVDWDDVDMGDLSELSREELEALVRGMGDVETNPTLFGLSVREWVILIAAILIVAGAALIISGKLRLLKPALNPSVSGPAPNMAISTDSQVWGVKYNADGLPTSVRLEKRTFNVGGGG